MSDTEDQSEPVTPVTQPRANRRLDAYGFEVRDEFAELFDQHEPTWREEEDERVHRWENFLAELHSTLYPGEPIRQDGPLIEYAVQCYRNAQIGEGGAAPCGGGQEAPVPTEAPSSTETAAEAGLLAGRFGMLVQAGIPRHLRAKVWPVLLGAEKGSGDEYAALVERALGHERKARRDGGSVPFDPELVPDADVATPVPGQVAPMPNGAVDGAPPEPCGLQSDDDAYCRQAPGLDNPSPGDAEAPSAPDGTKPRAESPTELVEWLAQVDKDLRRTFPGHMAMRREGLASLRRVLAAYAARNPVVGYCQGLNFVAATFLLFLPEDRAFWCLCAVVERVLPGYFSADMEVPALDARVLAQLLRGFFPATAAHLEALEVDVSSVTLHWFLCIFVNSLPLEACLRVWDQLFLERSAVVLFRVALALVDVFNHALATTCESSDAYMLLQALAPMSFDASRLIDTAAIGFRGVQPAAIDVLRDKFRREQALKSTTTDVGHHISWRPTSEEDEADSTDADGTPVSADGAGSVSSAASRPGRRSRDSLRSLHELRLRLSLASSEPENTSPHEMDADRLLALLRNDERPGSGPPAAAGLWRRRTASAAGFFDGLAGRNLRSFLLDRRRPSVVAALEAARPSPARGPTALRSRLALGAQEPAPSVSRVLFGGAGDASFHAPEAVLEVSMQVLRRHTVAGDETGDWREDGLVGVCSAESPEAKTAPRAASQPVLSALESQIAKVVALQKSKAQVLDELETRCAVVTARLTDLEGDLAGARIGVQAAAKALAGKADGLDRVSRRLEHLMRLAEELGAST